MQESVRDKLKTVSVATLTTALYKRGLRNQFIQDVHPLNPAAGNMVGEAYTLRYMPAREDLNPITVFKDRAHPQRKAVEECPPGAVLVIDSRKDARAASAGSILVARLMKRGVAGVVTDGGFRDSQEIARLAIPSYHHRPASPTNLTVHQAIDINVPIGCGDAPVFPGDVIVGDAEGVVVLPAHLAAELADEAVEMTAFEDFVTEEVMKGRSILGLYPATDERTVKRLRRMAGGEGAVMTRHQPLLCDPRSGSARRTAEHRRDPPDGTGRSSGSPMPMPPGSAKSKSARSSRPSCCRNSPTPINWSRTPRRCRASPCRCWCPTSRARRGRSSAAPT